MEFEELTQRHGQDVFRFFKTRVGDASLAEDLTQDTFVKAWKHFPPRSTASVRSWIFAIAANLFRDTLRRKQVRDRYLSELERQERKNLDRADQEDPKTWVQECLDSLDPESREVLMLREIEGMTVDEVSKHLGLSRDRVRYRIKKAREQFVYLYF